MRRALQLSGGVGQRSPTPPTRGSMATFQFSPDGRRRGRQRYQGRLGEPPAEPIPLVPTAANLRMLVEAGAGVREPSYSHRAIARWCGDLVLAEQRRFD